MLFCMIIWKRIFMEIEATITGMGRMEIIVTNIMMCIFIGIRL